MGNAMTCDDKELLELAAKAAGMNKWAWCDKWGAMAQKRDEGGFVFDSYWNPLDDETEALRLAVKLKLHIGVNSENKVFCYLPNSNMAAMLESCEGNGIDAPIASINRVIVRAAAEIGRNIK